MLENKKVKENNIDLDIEIGTYKKEDIDGNFNKKDSELIFKEIDGTDIRTFAREHKLSLKEVETMVKNKLLISRYQNGMLYVYDNRDYDVKNEYDYIAELKDVDVDVLDDSLENINVENDINEEDKEYKVQDEQLNFKSHDEDLVETQDIRKNDSYENEDISQDTNNVNNLNNIEGNTNSFYTLPSVNNINLNTSKEGVQKYDDNLNTMGYLAVLAENLKISKQEQIELLKLTQESIKRVVESTEKLVETKNSIIQEKDKIISSLEEKLSLSNKKASLILQENEDLKILVDTLENR